MVKLRELIIPLLDKLSDSEGKYWYKFLTDAEYAINNTTNKSTGKTPNKLLFGVEQRGKAIDDLKEYLLTNEVETQNSLVKIREKASNNIEHAQAYNKKSHDKSINWHINVEADLVMLRNFDSTSGSSKELIPSSF